MNGHLTLSLPKHTNGGLAISNFSTYHCNTHAVHPMIAPAINNTLPLQNISLLYNSVCVCVYARSITSGNRISKLFYSINLFPCFGNQFPDSKSHSLPSETQFPGSKCLFPNLEHLFLNSETQFPGSESLSPDSETLFLGSESQFLNAKSGFLKPKFLVSHSKPYFLTKNQLLWPE